MHLFPLKTGNKHILHTNIHAICQVVVPPSCGLGHKWPDGFFCVWEIFRLHLVEKMRAIYGQDTATCLKRRPCGELDP